MVGWHHCLPGHEFEQTLGISAQQGSLVYAVVHGVANSWTQLNDWTTTTRAFAKCQAPFRAFKASPPSVLTGL